MGYRSDVIVAMSKEEYVKQALIHTNIPQLMHEETMHILDSGMYWRIESIKWYDSYPEVQATIAFFNEMVSSSSAFGALRIGEEFGDVEEWGNPEDFGIYAQQTIDSPIPH